MRRAATVFRLTIIRDRPRQITAVCRAPVFVFEHFKGWRPNGARKGSTLIPCLHNWLYRALVRHVRELAEEVEFRLAFVKATYTSRRAFDGSG